MSDPVSRYLTTYKPQQVKGAPDPVDDYLKKYGPKPTIVDTLNQIKPQATDVVQTPIVPVAELPKPQMQLEDVLARPDITDAQRQRVERLIHQRRKEQAQEGIDKPEPLAHRTILSGMQGALDLAAAPLDVASSIPIVKEFTQPAAEVLHHVSDVLEPTMDPNQSQTWQELAQTAGYTAGSMIVGAKMFRVPEAAAGRVGQAISKLSPRLAAASAKALDAAALKIEGSELLTEFDRKILANAVRQAPKEMVASTLFTAMTNPDALTTKEGVGMTALFAVAASLTRGQQLTKAVAQAERVAQAQAVVDEALSGTTELSPEMAKVKLEHEQQKAASEARAVARRAWQSATPEMRKVLVPEVDETTITTVWKNLSREKRDLVIERVQGSLAKAAELTPEVQPGDPGGELQPSGTGEVGAPKEIGRVENVQPLREPSTGGIPPESQIPGAEVVQTQPTPEHPLRHTDVEGRDVESLTEQEIKQAIKDAVNPSVKVGYKDHLEWRRRTNIPADLSQIEWAKQSGSEQPTQPSFPSGSPAEPVVIRTPAEQSGSGGEGKPEPLPRTLDELDNLIDKAEKSFDKGELTDDQYTARLDEISAAKSKIKLAQVKTKQVVPTTRRQLERSSLKQVPLGVLKDAQTRLQVELNNAEGPAEVSSIEHDLTAIRRELRWRKPVKDLKDPSLDTHANELKADLQEVSDQASVDKITARLADVAEEFKRRARPNPIDMINNERGSMTFDRDPLESDAGILSGHEQRVQDQIVVGQFDGVYPGLEESWFTKSESSFAHTVRGSFAFEKFDKVFGLVGAPTVKSAGKWADLISGSAGRAQHFLETGERIDWNAEGTPVVKETRGHKEILEPFKGRLNELRRYELAMGTIQRMQDAKKTGVELMDAIRVVENTKADVKAAAAERVTVRRAALRSLSDSGMFSKEVLAQLETMVKYYVPIDRWLMGKPTEMGTERVGARQGKNDLSSVGPGEQVKRFQGGNWKIIDPIQSDVSQTRRFFRAADLNHMSRILVESAESNPEAAKGLIWKDEKTGYVKLEPKTQQQADLIKSEAKRLGLEGITDDVAKNLALGLSDQRLKTRSDKLYYWRDGKVEVWNIAPELAEAYMHLSPQELHMIVKVLGFVPSTAKQMITDNPAFAAFNAIKDNFDASAQSKYGFRFGIDAMKGFANALSNTEFRNELRAAIGVSGGIGARSFESTEQSMRAIVPRTAGESAINIVRHPLDALRKFARPFEEAARMGEFIRARQAGAPIADATLAAQRVTTNFRQVGLSMRAVSHMTMFLNPAIQSLHTNWRAMSEQPGRVAAVGVLGITLPTMLLWFANKDDKEIQELRKSRAGLGYTFFRYPGGTIGKFPKAFLFGQIFGTGIESVLDKMFEKDPTSLERFAEGLWSQIGFNVIPTTLDFTTGLMLNKDWSTGGDISPNADGSGEVSPRYQSRPTTGPIANALGDLFNISPAKIDYTVRNALGTLGQDALRGLDMLTNARAKYPTPVHAEWPVVGRLLGNYPSTNVHSVQRFYNEATKSERVANDAKMLEKRGDMEGLKKIYETKKWEIATAETYADARKTLADLRGTINFYRDVPQGVLTSARKRELIDLLTNQMVTYARQMNTALDEAKKNFKP